MIGKLKNILGIEGVKIKLVIDKEQSTPNLIEGKLLFTSQSKRHVEKLEIKLIEKYKRGRSDSKLINDYLLGSLELEVDFDIEKGEEKSFDFKLSYNKMKSEMDIMEENILSRPFIFLAKKLKNVKSEYRVEATAKITGTKFHPITEEKVNLD